MESGRKGGKRLAPSQETPTDRSDRRLDKARAFIYSVRLLLTNHLQGAPCVDGGAEYGSASVSLCPSVSHLGHKTLEVKPYSVHRGISE